jgi:hypothetical protein
MDGEVLIRLVSSGDHKLGRDELVKIIRSTGTDRYDPDRKQMFDDFYGKHRVDFFAGSATKENLEKEISEAIEKLPARTKGDRGYEVVPDILILYDASKCEMIDGVYDYKSGSDCYRFITKPIDALLEVREI